MKILDSGTLRLKLNNPQRVLTAIPGSVPENANSVIVEWTIENSRRLHRLNITTPSPIRRDYDWPGMFKPYDHQRTTAEFLTLNDKAFCFSEQGTGKTAAAIWATDYLMNIGDIKRALIVCPLSVMHSAWMTDLFKTVMHRTAAVAHGSKDKRRAVIAGESEFVIINYDGIPLLPELAGKFDLIIADECNFVKSTTTRRWRAFNRLILAGTKLWMMTGTPAAQSPVDAFGLAKLVNPRGVPRFFGSWRDKVMIQAGQFRWMPRLDATRKVNAVLQPAIRFTKAACLDLPPITYQTREVPLTKQQEKYYLQIKRRAVMVADGEIVSAVHAAAGLNKLLQISCGAVYSDTGEVIEFHANNRLDEMLSAVQETSHKTIVFVPFRHAIVLVANKLKKAGVNAEIINGSVSVKARTTIIRKFQEETDPQVLVIQPQSASHGITLTAADTIVWFGPIASVETWLQANERINRPSQENKMTVIKLCGSPVERKVYKALETKEVAQRDLTALYEAEIYED